MAGILYDARKVKAFEVLQMLCEGAEESAETQNQLWQLLLEDSELYTEFLYYVEHHALLGKMNVCGYTLLDLFVLEMDSYNLLHDQGKNTASCNKEAMILHAFLTMAELKKDPEKYLKKFSKGSGMDRL